MVVDIGLNTDATTYYVRNTDSQAAVLSPEILRFFERRAFLRIFSLLASQQMWQIWRHTVQ